MLKKVFASFLCMFMALGMMPKGVQNVRANEVQPYVIVRDLPISEKQTQVYTATYNGETSNVSIDVTLDYVKHIVGNDVTYDSFHATLKESTPSTPVTSFYVKAYGSPKLSVNIASKKVFVTGEVQIYYRRGTTNVLVKTESYNLTYNLK